MNEKQISRGVRMAFRDVSFTYRMGAGFAGDVNRTHPVEIEAALMDVNDPVAAYGQMGLYDVADNTIRAFRAADQSDAAEVTPFGALVRPFPLQAPAGSSNAAQGLGAATPPASGVTDWCRSGLLHA
jgi:hypothetical protein